MSTREAHIVSKGTLLPRLPSTMAIHKDHHLASYPLVELLQWLEHLLPIGDSTQGFILSCILGLYDDNQGHQFSHLMH